MRLPLLVASAVLLSLALGGCDDSGENQSLILYYPQVTNNTTGGGSTDTTIQILHVGDGEAGLEAVGDLPRFSAVLEALRRKRPQATLVLSTGDNWIPGPFYTAGGDPALAAVLDGWGMGNAGSSNGPGRADIACMNLMGFAASTFGNHEFDNSTATIASIIGVQGDVDRRSWEGAWFPYLSANLDFSQDGNLASLVTADGQDLEYAGSIAGRISGSAIVDCGGTRVGLVGATTPQLPRISSPGAVVVAPADETDYAALAAIIQAQVDILAAQDVRIVVLLAHMQQFDVELNRLAPLLRSVDVVLAGGSNSLLADADDILRSDETQTPVGDYPMWTTGADGAPVAVVNTPGNWRYVGRLTLTFNEAGTIRRDRHDPTRNGIHGCDNEGVRRLAAQGLVHPGVAEIVATISNTIEEKTATVAGHTGVYLNGLRADVRTQETNLGNLTADANLWRAQDAFGDVWITVSIKNGGGIRDSIGSFSSGDNPLPQPPAGGLVTQLDIENSLRFNNHLTVMDLGRREFVQVIEHALSGSAPGATPGRFPQLSGVELVWDPNGTAQVLDDSGNVVTPGSRVQELRIIDRFYDRGVLDTLVVNGQFQGPDGFAIPVVTLDFLAEGGDGYPFPSYGERLRPLPSSGEGFNNTASEQYALFEYLQAFHPEETPFSDPDQPEPTQDVRIKVFIPHGSN